MSPEFFILDVNIFRLFFLLPTGKTETVKAFHYRCCCAQDLISDDPRSNPNYERDVLLNFVLGLQKEFQNAVLKSDARDLKSFKEAAESAETKSKFPFSSEFVTVKIETTNIDEADIHVESMDSFQDQIKEECFEETEGESFSEEGKNIHQSLVCSICGHSLDEKGALEDHINFEHSAESMKFQCDNCPATFASLKIFKVHMDLLHSELMHPCDMCDHESFNMKMHILHQTIWHRPDSSKIICRLCNAEFKVLRSLRTHVHEHHLPTKPYPCKVCDKSFRAKGMLEEHMRTAHLNERPFKCDICADKAYVKYAGLMYHKRSAHGIGEKFKCSQCSKLFNSKQV